MTSSVTSSARLATYRMFLRSLTAQLTPGRHHPTAPPDPIEAIKFRMEQQGLTPRDLEPMIGRRNRVYEVLSGKRGLSMEMVRRLHRQLDIPLIVGEVGTDASAWKTPWPVHRKSRTAWTSNSI